MNDTGKKSAAKVIDFEFLDLFTKGKREVEDEVLASFMVSAERYLERLAAAAAETEWHDAAHGLKGLANGVGAGVLADAADKAMDRYNDPGRSTVLDGLRKALGEVREIVDGRGQSD